jgi:hypothetical protein
VTLNGWIADLEELAKLYPAKTTVYGGRGQSIGLKLATNEQIAYLRKADGLVGDYVKRLGTGAKVELTGANAGKHYAAIQAEFEKAFPGYGLGYMIGYGVYGLVNSKL